MAGTDEIVWQRLEDQISWYEGRSARAKHWFLRMKVVQIVVAAAIPVAAGSGAAAWITGSLGACIVVLEGLQQLFQFQQNWVTYRGTAEGLKHERYLFLARAGPYGGDGPVAQLAQRVEALVSREETSWSAAQLDAGAHSR
jgi:hypothetical protein